MEHMCSSLARVLMDDEDEGVKRLGRFMQEAIKLPTSLHQLDGVSDAFWNEYLQCRDYQPAFDTVAQRLPLHVNLEFEPGWEIV